MVLIKNFEEFYSAAEELYNRNPDKTRYVIKYRHCEGQLEMKVTDDKVCLKYRTEQMQDVKKMEKMNALFFKKMTS